MRALSRVWSKAAAPSRPTSSFGVNTSSIPACGRFSLSTRRVASSITATADLLSAPRMVPAAFRTTPSSTTGSIGPVGGTVSRWAQKKSGVPSPLPSIPAWTLPIVEPTVSPAASSSTWSPRSWRYLVTASATRRSSPGGLGIAASSVNRSSTSDTRAILRATTRRPSGRCADRRAVVGARERGADELPEERRRPRRARLELRVELAGHEPGMVGELDDLDEPTLLERSGHSEPRVDQRRAVVVVDLVAVAVSLVDDGLAVCVVGACPLHELDRLRTQSHRAAEILDLLLLRQQVDHRVRGLRVHLRRIRPFETEHVPCVLRDRDVHAETDPEVRDAPVPRDAAGE